jgi:hypothetical protein
MNSLLTITSCNRLEEVKKYIWAYIDFCNNHKEFFFLLAIDGTDQAYLDFCNQYRIPVVFSDEREGVGLAKNRVLAQFPNFDYYFFIDDDVELVNSRVFEIMIALSQKQGYPHMSITALKKVIAEEQKVDQTIFKGFYGGGYFNFFTKTGLEAVGGWHTAFARHKRYGHTEHSFRYMHSGLADFPFIVPHSLLSYVLLHDPPHVTKIVTEENVNELIAEEQEMIDHKQAYFPLTTLSKIHFNQIPFGYNEVVADLLMRNRSRYPLLKGRQKAMAWSNYYFHLYRYARSCIKRLFFFTLSLTLNPVNVRIKHRIKELLGLNKKVATDIFDPK